MSAVTNRSNHFQGRVRLARIRPITLLLHNGQSTMAGEQLIQHTVIDQQPDLPSSLLVSQFDSELDQW